MWGGVGGNTSDTAAKPYTRYDHIIISIMHATALLCSMSLHSLHTHTHRARLAKQQGMQPFDRVIIRLKLADALLD